MPIGVDFTWEKASKFFPRSAEAAGAGRGMEFAVFEITWKLWHPQAARDLLSLYQDWRPDVVVREFAENGATFAGEASGVPVVCAAWGALPTDRHSWGRVWDRDRMLVSYSDLRHELGLAPEPPGGAWQRQLTFSTLPVSWLGDVSADVVMTVGRDVDTRDVGPVPGNVRIEPFVAQSLVLPRAALVVSRGESPGVV